MKLKVLALTAIMLVSATSHAKYLCSYTAYISDNNKVNSSGKSVVSGVNKSSVAQILRQNRADVHRFGVGTFGDSDDCYFASSKNRSRIPTMLNKGSISQSTIRQIVNGNPLLQVDIYSDRIDVRPY